MALVFNVTDVAYKTQLQVKYGDGDKAFDISISSKEMDEMKEILTKEDRTDEETEAIIKLIMKDDYEEIKASMDSWNFENLAAQLLGDIAGKIYAERMGNLNQVVMSHQKNGRK